jgi:putative spermidine/putrescine transport system ATP-binding protein
MSEPGYLTLDKLTLAYGATTAVEALDLEVARGELMALLGPSGCGKTTTMRSIAGLMSPASGRIVVGGRDVTRVAANKRNIGLVFQSYALFPHMTVHDNVAFGLKLRGVPGGELARRTAAAIDRVGLGGFEARLPAALSGGQQQRVALARAIVVEPQLLLLDEPLSNLDARLRLEMRTELKRLQGDLGITMIYVTHDQAEALALADRIAVMRAGRIAQLAPAEVIYERPRSIFVARFVGYENVFRVEAGRLLAHGQGEGLLLTQALPSDVLALGWRPQGVPLGTGPYQGTVRGASYLGQTVEYLVETQAGPIKVERPVSEGRIAPGTATAFDLPVQHAAALTEE